ncbi:DUF2147 domain-containing protein [Roseovarius salinarum]|uniref:DUF2147 domain-containing protein n=1 Tax=Roseovarius salinarum TaxID=1981892 RepID=UPI000C33ED98|nr:DUF2147 domain-containing protein [Roseovarius salinarum]
MWRVVLLTALVSAGSGWAGPSDAILGLWRTGPDSKGQVAHVKVQECDRRICGRIVAAFSAEGEPVTSPNEGKLVFWNMSRTAPSRYSGRAWVPAHDRVYDAGARIAGDRMKVFGCLGPFCRSQVWTRVE